MIKKSDLYALSPEEMIEFGRYLCLVCENFVHYECGNICCRLDLPLVDVAGHCSRFIRNHDFFGRQESDYPKS